MYKTQFCMHSTEDNVQSIKYLLPSPTRIWHLNWLKSPLKTCMHIKTHIPIQNLELNF